MLRWHLILTKPSGEETAQLHLERQGYRVYFPRIEQPTLYRGRWRDRVTALFPRYLFLQLDADSQSLAPVRSTTGVAGAVRFGADFAVVPSQVVDGLIRRADPLSGLHKLKRRLFESGDAVRIVAGAFAGLEGIFEREAGEDRVVILLRLLSQETRVSIAAGFVVPEYAA